MCVWLCTRVCACVCVCVRVAARACVRACLRYASGGIQGTPLRCALLGFDRSEDAFLDGKRHGNGLAGNEFGFTKIDNSDDYLRRCSQTPRWPLLEPILSHIAVCHRWGGLGRSAHHDGLQHNRCDRALLKLLRLQGRRRSNRAHRSDGWRVLASR